ncbi:MAG: LysM peptidoglycan-binding domain-containing protein [Candidatus Omnitrophica bacterium]|nr:LysM peptidoglycan-binding domain-containing protein [Candidatus Omnitrophota bacterium]MCM8802705.1 LysM peptidoglycan-binding domain-containing protein [Candidatus Omnitrophota bacterium]
MRKKVFITIFSFGIALIFNSCSDIATKDDIDAIKEKINNLEDDFYATVKQIGEKFNKIETDYKQGDEKIKKNINETNENILVLSNEVNNLKDEIKGVKGKIDENNFEQSEKIKKLSDEFIEKNIEIKKDIEGIKKDIEGVKLVYNDLSLKTANMHQGLIETQSNIKTDIVNLRDTQIKIVTTLQDLPKKIDQIDEKINQVDRKINEVTKSFLEELTRHESEIYQLKKHISEHKIEPTSEPVRSILKTGKERYHIVQKGEYLTKIAKKYDTSVSEIKKLNNLKSDTIYPGQKLLIP